MSVASEITRIKDNIDSAYSFCEEKEAMMPTVQNSDNLANTISSITKLNFTDMGNELRKAYAYKYSKDVNQQCRLCFSTANMVDAFNCTWCSILSEAETGSTGSVNGSVYVIDGKLYAASKDGSDIILTQLGTDSDWIWAACGVFAKSNAVYIYSNSSGTFVQKMTGSNPQPIYNVGGTRSNIRPCVINNTLYKNLGDTSEGYVISDIRICFYEGYYLSYIKNSDNKFYFMYNNVEYCPFTSTSYTPDNLFVVDASAAHFINNTFYYYDVYYDTSFSCIHDYKIKSLMGTLMFIDINNDVYSINSNTQKISKIGTAIDYQRAFWIDTNYKLRYGSNTTFSITLPETARIKKNYDYKYSTNRNGCMIVYDGSTIESEILYTTSLMSKFYSRLNASSPNITSFTKNTNSITYNNKRYNRSQSDDQVFAFIPNELSSHNFSDQELCQAYLAAGATVK